MKTAELKAAAKIMLDKFLTEGKTEWSTRDYTAAIYPMSRSVCITYMKKDTDEWPVQRYFDIKIG